MPGAEHRSKVRRGRFLQGENPGKDSQQQDQQQPRCLHEQAGCLGSGLLPGCNWPLCCNRLLPGGGPEGALGRTSHKSPDSSAWRYRPRLGCQDAFLSPDV
mmetsp:Transcript_27434/g.77620  ORF Transcript_27434/g.77620 Transcript_27434/m.77620 type:complete len:101 (+) Transcript_27434:927-1229(+)